MAEISSSKPRTLVLCFDGTSNQYDADNTNVVKLFALLKKNDFNEQLAYYQPGVGTYFNPGVVSPMFEWFAKILDFAIAWYLDAHVMDGYKFLMQNYRVGDKICIFGFSRGAYTARALAGFLHKTGLLPRDNESQVPFAYKLYKREDKDGIELCAGFKQTYCQNVKVEFLGVWDTVASVGILLSRSLPFTNSNTSIRTFRHALSLDEHRTKFRPNTYHRTAPDPASAAKDPQHASLVVSRGGNGPNQSDVSSSSNSNGKPPARGWTKRFQPSKSYIPDVEDDGVPDDVLEVWFSGCHTDIGGGSMPNATKSELADISLRWMMREVVKSGCGIQFDPAALVRASIELISEPNEATIESDKVDALTSLHDGLTENFLWWILEVIPFGYSWQDEKGKWHKTFVPNFGRGRTINDPKPIFHATVKERIQGMKYTPKAKWAKGSETYIE
ncbi:hypothetical protein BDQ17DRAFT_1386764 [Cyathus striatus]|nr:hypothetical protein BDQ17DRAFT_1386764 [Cyathus striatus]